MSKIKILVSIWPGLGDILFITPTLRILKKKYPKSFVTVVSLWGGPGKSLLELNPYIDELIFSKTPHFLKLIKKFSKEKYDYGLELSFPVKWFFYLSKVKVKISFAKGFLWWLFPYRNKKNSDLHACEQYLLATDKIDGKITRDDKGYELFLSEDDIKFADNIYKDIDCSTIIVIHPGARCNKNKRWDIKNIIEVLKRLTENKKTFIITIGGNEDCENGRIIKKSIGNKNLNLIGKTSLRQTAAIIKKADLFIGHDSGPTHIASVFSPVVAIFASSNPKNFRPYIDKAIVVKPKKKCAPCFHFPGYMHLLWGLRLRWFNYCPAMDTITVDDVYNACVRALELWKKK